MDAVDILQFAVEAARMIRNSSDPHGVYNAAWERFAGTVQQPSENIAWSVRIAQLVEASQQRRSELYHFLKQFRGQLYLNRNSNLDEGSNVPELVPDPLAQKMFEHICSDAGEAEKIYLFLGDNSGPYEIGRRRIIHTVDRIEGEIDFPKIAYGLIDDPLEHPILFEIVFEEEDYWNLSEVFEAFADQYHRIYENPKGFGVTGHDLSNLWIEQLRYYPSKKLIYPYIGT